MKGTVVLALMAYLQQLHELIMCKRVQDDYVLTSIFRHTLRGCILSKA